MARSTEDLIVYGVHPVEEFLIRQAHRAKELVVRQGSINGLKELISLANSKNVPVRLMSNADFGRYSGSRKFQGLFLRTSPFEYADIESINISGNTMLVALDSVKDPHNLGSILRTSAFFGVDGLILPKNRSVQVTPTVLKTSAGGAYLVPVFQVTNLARTLRNLKNRGLWIIGADSNTDKDVNTVDIPKPIVLVLGAEGEGLRQNIKKNCDLLVKIPSKSGFDSLNVSVAGGILIHRLRT